MVIRCECGEEGGGDYANVSATYNPTNDNFDVSGYRRKKNGAGTGTELENISTTFEWDGSYTLTTWVLADEENDVETKASVEGLVDNNPASGHEGSTTNDQSGTPGDLDEEFSLEGSVEIKEVTAS